MKRRITYVTTPDEVPDPKSKLFQITKSALEIKPQPNQKFHAAREDRLIFALEELPKELTSILEQCREFHIRWASEAPYESLTPFASRVSPGLHVFATLAEQGYQETQEDLCQGLKKLFGEQIKCTTFQEAFIPIPSISSRFSRTTTHQYYTPLSSPSQFLTYLQTHLTNLSSFHLSPSPDSLDLSFTSMSHTLTFSTYYASAPASTRGWEEEISATTSNRTEIGILFPTDPLPSSSNNDEDDEATSITLSGGLLVLENPSSLDPNDAASSAAPKFSPTLFSTPSRHHIHPGTFTTSFKHPTGLHPILTISFPSSITTTKKHNNPAPLTPPFPPTTHTCPLHLYLTLPSTLFLDKYAFRDPLALQSHNLLSLRSLVGATDLEAPEWNIPQWGSVAVFELALPSHASDTEFEVTIPLHTRYLTPTFTNPSSSSAVSNTTINEPANTDAPGYTTLSIPPPTLFFTCASPLTPSHTKQLPNPFDRVHLGYEALFGERVAFWHLTPAAPSATSIDAAAGESLMLRLQVPVLDLGAPGARYVEVGTVAAVLLGFFWVVWCLVRPVQRVARPQQQEGKKAR